MYISSLNFNNKNEFRKYPVKQGMSLCSDSGATLPDDIIVNCSITTVYGMHRLYVRQVFYKNTEARIAIASVLDDRTLGVFAGTVVENYTTLTLTSFVPNLSGNLTIGSVSSLTGLNSTLHFSSSVAELEESVIFCYTAPAVTSIRDAKGATLTGDVNFGLLTNITKTTDITTKTTQLQASNPAAVFNMADKSSALGNCPNPIIKNINGVVPSPIGGIDNPSSVNDGNIYLVGVSPIVFYGVPSTQGKVKIETEGVTLDSLCAQKHKLLPPTDVCGFTDPEHKNLYYSKKELPSVDVTQCDSSRPERLAGSFYETHRPEYYFWPQFVKPEYYSLYWKTP